MKTALAMNAPYQPSLRVNPELKSRRKPIFGSLSRHAPVAQSVIHLCGRLKSQCSSEETFSRASGLLSLLGLTEA